MTTYTLSPSGGPVDACWHNGSLVCVWQDGPGPNAQLVERVIGRGNGLTVSSVTYPLGDDVGAFPRVMSDGSDVWLLYREGRSRGGQAILRKNGIVVWRSPSECGGNDPVCFGVEHGMAAFAWQKAGTNEILSGLVGWPSAQLPGGEGRPTGLSHIQANGVVVLVDDARASVPGMTRPAWAGSLVVGEGSDSGVVVRDTTTGLVAHLWPYEETFTPRVCVDRDLYAVVTWGRPGVRVGYLTTSDLSVPTPTPQPPPIVVPEPEQESLMYRSVAPSMFHEVERLHEEQPRLIYSPHAFTREIARRLHAIDARWGDNGKRGNANDLSEDCVAFKAPGSPAGGVEIYDIIAGANSPSASPAWIDQTQVTADKGTVGVWVRPQGAVTPVPTPVPAPSPQPTPTPTPAPSCRFAALDLEAVRAIVRDELARARPADDASNDVAALRERVEAINAEMHEMVVGQVNGLLQAIQSIRR